MGLARAGLAVREEAHVEPVEGRLHELGHLVEDGRLRVLRAEDLVEGEVVLLDDRLELGREARARVALKLADGARVPVRLAVRAVRREDPVVLPERHVHGLQEVVLPEIRPDPDVDPHVAPQLLDKVVHLPALLLARLNLHRLLGLLRLELLDPLRGRGREGVHLVPKGRHLGLEGRDLPGLLGQLPQLRELLPRSFVAPLALLVPTDNVRYAFVSHHIAGARPTMGRQQHAGNRTS